MQETEKRKLILDASLIRFSQYGLRKTSMQDIAENAGISRASIYSYFKNKDEIFRCVSIDVHEEAFRKASNLLGDTTQGDLRSRLATALYARHGRFLSLVLDSPQGAELEDEYSRLCGDVVSAYSKKFNDLLMLSIDAADGAGQLDLAGLGLSAERLATVLNLSAAGCKRGCTNMSEYSQRIADLVNLLISATRR